MGASAGLSANLGQNVSFYPVDRKRTYLQRWSFGAQQQLPHEFLVEATYVGNRGTHLGVNHQIDNTRRNISANLYPATRQPSIL